MDNEENENAAAASGIDEPFKNSNVVALKKNDAEANSQNENCALSCNEGTSSLKSDEQLRNERCSEKEDVFDANLSSIFSNSIEDGGHDASLANISDDYPELDVATDYYIKILIENARKMRYLNAQYQEKREKIQSVATENIECPPEILKKLEKNNISQLDNASSLDIATDFYNKILFGNYSHESVATTTTSDQDTAATAFCTGL